MSLRNDRETSFFCHDVLDLIAEGLLTVRISERMSHQEVHWRLKRFHEKAISDPSYCLPVSQAKQDDETLSTDRSDLESVVFSTFSQSSEESFESLDRGRASALDLVIGLLFNHEELLPLYQLAKAKVELGKLKTHLYGFFRIYGKELRQEAEDGKQIAASIFVRKNARHIAEGVTSHLILAEPSDPLSIFSHLDVQSKEETVENFLLSLDEDPRAGPSMRVQRGVEEPQDPDSSGDENEHKGENTQTDPDSTPHLNLDEVRSFLVTSKAFATLKSKLEDWVRVPEDPAVVEEREEVQGRQSEDVERSEVRGAEERIPEEQAEEREEEAAEEQSLRNFESIQSAELGPRQFNLHIPDEFTSLLHDMRLEEGQFSDTESPGTGPPAVSTQTLLQRGLVLVGLREPPIEEGYQRVRWKNVCPPISLVRL